MKHNLYVLRIYKKYGKDIVDSALRNLEADLGFSALISFQTGQFDLLTPYLGTLAFSEKRILKTF